MSPVDRPLAGDFLSFRLGDEIRALKAQMAADGGRLGHTLVKEGSLRVTLVGLRPGGAISPHAAEGAVTIQIIEGTLSLDVAGTTRSLTAGDLVTLASGIRHAAASAGGAIFLLTLAVTHPGG